MSVVERREGIQALRGQMWSPGRPSKARREDRVRFWEVIGRGVSSEDAAGEVGVSSAVGSRHPRSVNVKLRLGRGRFGVPRRCVRHRGFGV